MSRLKYMTKGEIAGRVFLYGTLAVIVAAVIFGTVMIAKQGRYNEFINLLTEGVGREDAQAFIRTDGVTYKLSPRNTRRLFFYASYGNPYGKSDKVLTGRSLTFYLTGREAMITMLVEELTDGWTRVTLTQKDKSYRFVLTDQGEYTDYIELATHTDGADANIVVDELPKTTQ